MCSCRSPSLLLKIAFFDDPVPGKGAGGAARIIYRRKLSKEKGEAPSFVEGIKENGVESLSGTDLHLQKSGQFISAEGPDD